MKKANVVVVGGGTGLSNLLRGLKHFPINISAIVSVADDGGSTGKLREDYDIPAPGDLRNVMVSLSKNESLIEEMFQYRFKEGNLKGHCLGNIMLTGMLGLTGSMSESTKALSEVLDMCGEVIPVSDQSLQLCAKLSNGEVLRGESVIGKAVKTKDIKIEEVFYEQNVKATERSIKAIEKADYIVFGIGSLYTSIAPNLIVEEIRNEIAKSGAEKIYICNAMQQPGETVGYSVFDHIKAVEYHLKQNIDTVFVNKDMNISGEIIKRYQREGVDLVKIDEEDLKNYNVVSKNLLTLDDNCYIRHDNIKLGMAIYSHILEKQLNS